jgi:hypothetical protein
VVLLSDHAIKNQLPSPPSTSRPANTASTKRVYIVTEHKIEFNQYNRFVFWCSHSERSRLRILFFKIPAVGWQAPSSQLKPTVDLLNNMITSIYTLLLIQENSYSRQLFSHSISSPELSKLFCPSVILTFTFTFTLTPRLAKENTITKPSVCYHLSHSTRIPAPAPPPTLGVVRDTTARRSFAHTHPASLQRDVQTEFPSLSRLLGSTAKRSRRFFWTLPRALGFLNQPPPAQISRPLLNLSPSSLSSSKTLCELQPCLPQPSLSAGPLRQLRPSEY